MGEDHRNDLPSNGAQEAVSALFLAACWWMTRTALGYVMPYEKVLYAPRNERTMPGLDSIDTGYYC